MTHALRPLAVTLLALGFLAGCDNLPWSKSKDASARATGADTVAVAKIAPSEAATTQPANGLPTGTVTFTQIGDKVKVVADLKGLKPDTKHGFHIHEKGDLSAADLSSAGGHYNPEHHEHGAPHGGAVHAGDLGNVMSDDKGNVHYEITVDNISVNGEKNPIVGKAVIVHARADDLKSQPSGDAGARIGGGIIELQK